jgi:SAM-dependent methyltransferase
VGALRRSRREEVKKMSEAVRLPAAESSVACTPKDKSCLLGILGHYLELCAVDRSKPVLVLGGEQEDVDILTACGFNEIVLSNIEAADMAIDAENIALPDDSYPVVFAHAVLHHCRCPQKAVGEMVRVSQQHVFFVEPNDSWILRLLVHLNFSFPYELTAVAAHEYVHGGMRDGPIPNYIYRWTGREVEKCIASYHPERQFEVHAHPYWDFYVNEEELINRKESRVAILAEKIGPRTFVKLLHLGQAVLNLSSLLRSQGNKFLCAVSKRELQAWIEMRDGGCYLKKGNKDSW